MSTRKVATVVRKGAPKAPLLCFIGSARRKRFKGGKLPEKLRRGAKPTLKQFSERFLEVVLTRSAAKPRTIEFYEQQTT